MSLSSRYALIFMCSECVAAFLQVGRLYLDPAARGFSRSTLMSALNAAACCLPPVLVVKTRATVARL